MPAKTKVAVLETARQHFNAGDIAAYLTTLYAPDTAAYFLPPGLPPGSAGLELFYGAFHASFPDAQLYLDDVLAAGDKLAVRYHIDATHSGAFNGIPATGKRVTFGGATIMRFADSKVVERWSESDFLGLMQQLGVVPA
jgi:predicted SnoaL-like aldol condensation-catalyzing enzyme